MDQFHTGIGIIKYDPYRSQMKNRTTGWCVLNIDRGIADYYRNWLRVEKHIHLQEPSWVGHISIVRGETLNPRVQQLWKKYNNQSIDFTYDPSEYHCAPDKKHGGLYYWINADAPLFGEIRKELCLPIGWRFHITIGRTYEYDAHTPKTRK
jgi:hypothetical protein